MLLNKLGYDLPGNAFHVVPRDFTMRNLEIHTLRERELYPAGLTEEWEWSSHSLWEPEGDGKKHIPVPPDGIFIVLDLPGRGKPLPVQLSSCCIFMGTKEKAPKLGVVSGILSPAGKRGQSWAGSIQLWLGITVMRGELAESCSGGWISWRSFLGWEWGHPPLRICVHQVCIEHQTLQESSPQWFIHPAQSESSGVLPFTMCWGHFYPEKHHKIPSPAWREAPLLSPPSPGCAASQGCASLPLHSWQKAWIYWEQTPFIWLKEAKMQHNAQCFRPEKKKKPK